MMFLLSLVMIFVLPSGFFSEILYEEYFDNNSNSFQSKFDSIKWEVYISSENLKYPGKLIIINFLDNLTC